MKTASIFIVDDEPLIVDGLCVTIASLGLPIEIAGTAYDGDTALPAIRACRPDLILSDIRMKHMDGLALAERLKTLLPFSKTILLSGYHEFSYAQSALRSSVFDYLLKPVSDEALSACLKKALAEIARQEGERESLAALQQHLVSTRPFLRELFYKYVKSGEIHSGEGGAYRHVFGDLPEQALYLTVFVGLETPGSVLSENRYGQMSRLLDQICCIADSETIRCLPFYDYDDLLLILIYPRNASGMELEKPVEDIREMLEFNLEANFSIGLGIPVDELCKLPEEYLHAKTASQYRFYLGNNRVIRFEDLEGLGHSIGTEYQEEIKYQLSVAMKVGNKEAARAQMENYIAALRACGQGISVIKSNCMELFLSIVNSVCSLASQEPFPEARTAEIISELWQCGTIDDMAALLFSFIGSTMAALSEKRTDKSSRIVAQIKKIIDENYRTVSLESICTEIGLSPSYTSNLFSSVENVTIKDYIIRQKIEHAKELLKSLRYKVYEVADLVGYSDAKYFSQIFRRQTGMTPEQFRNYA